MRIERFFVWIVLLLISVWQTMANVVPSETTNGKRIVITNNTKKKFRMGGIRFRNKGFKWTGVDGFQDALYINNNPNNEVEVYMNKTASLDFALLYPESTSVITHSWTMETNTEIIPGSLELLLKTETVGSTEEVEGEAPIEFSDISSIIAHPNYYNESYRYIDSLGLRGGIHSGGIHDTWKDETQIQFAVPTNEITINAEKTTIDTTLSHYWMALAIVQELFNADAQYFAAMSMQETNMGIKTLTKETGSDVGIFGHWALESTTGLDRALLFPQLFPKYETALSKAMSISHTGIKAEEFMKYYTCGDQGLTPERSALILNGLLMAYLVNRANYNVYSYASDICWKDALETAIDPYMGATMILPTYNRGLSGALTYTQELLNKENINATCTTPNTANLLSPNLGSYPTNVLTIIKKLEESSKKLQTEPIGKDATFVNPLLSKNEILDMFFGDNGTVEQQGNGGLLLHFYDLSSDPNAISIRQKIWTNVSNAFDLLAGKSPVSEANKISFRYDFLTLIRTVKKYFPLHHQFIVCGDVDMQTRKYSKIGGCSEFDKDTLYPRAEVVGLPVLDTDFKAEIRGTDDMGVKQATWTIDSQWGTWHNAIHKSGSGKDQTFSITVPQSVLAAELGGKEGTLWYMVTDEAGYSVIKTIPITTDDENKAPTDISLSTNTFENTIASGAAFAKIFSEDPNIGDTKEYAVLTASSPFTIKSSDSLALVGTSPSPGDHPVKLQVTDGGGLTYSEEFTISVTAVTPDKYTLTVTSGSGDGDYEENATAGISADAPEAGFEFSHWESPIKCIADTLKASTSLTMPKQDLTVVATYKAVVNPDTYTLSVTGGTGGGSYEQGASVPITANTPQTGYEFDRWRSSVVCIADTLKANTSLTMPGQDLTIEALFKRKIHTLTVESGTGSGQCAYDSTVSITANDIENYTFTHWSGDTEYIASTSEKKTTVQMPDKSITLTANYKAVEYALLVHNGTGSGNYIVNTEVPITAKDSTGYTFSGWSGNVVTFKQGGKAIDTVVIPAKDIEIKAEYKPNDVPTYVLTITDALGDRTHNLEDKDTLTIEARDKADSANAQFKFSHWSDPSGVLSTTSEVKSLVTMKNSAATVTANYAIFNHKVTDFSLATNSIKGDAAQGSTIANFRVTDQDVDDNYTFEIVGSSNDFEIVDNKLCTKRMFSSSEYNTALAVTVQCSDKGSTKEKELEVQILNPDQKTAELTVVNGLSTTTTSYNVGTIQKIKADEVSEKAFEKWTGAVTDIVEGALTDAVISVKIPDSDITLTANYVTQTFYTLKVNNGSGSTERALAGEEIEVKATVPTGYSFTSWSGGDEYFKLGGLVIDTIQMPASDLTITAHFTKNEGSHSLLEKLLEDNVIDGKDFTYVAQEWNNYQQNKLDDLLELAPYTGQRPNILVTPNQTFDYSDLSSFTALCYFYSNLRRAKSRQNDTPVDAPLQWKTSWAGDKLLVTLSVDAIEDLLTCSFASETVISDLHAESLLLQKAEPFSFITKERADVTRLTAGTLGVSGDGAVATIVLNPQEGERTVRVHYTLRNSAAEVIARGEKELDLPSRSGSGISVQVTPSPCALSEGEVLTFHIDASKEFADGALQVSLVVLDKVGDLLIKKNVTLESATGTIEWNGITDKGVRISSGTCKAIVRCSNGSLSETKELLIAVEE